MAIISHGAFSAHLRRLDRDALARFVADVWTARGWRTEIESDASVVVATDADGIERRLLVVDARRRFGRRSVLSGHRPPVPTGRSVDTVVAADADATATLADDLDARLVGPDDLHGMVLYGVDRDDCERLFQTHLGTSHLVEPLPAETSGRFARGPLVVTLVVACLVVVSGAVALGPTLAGSGLETDSEPVGTPTADVPPTPTPEGDARRTDSESETTIDGRYPPGVTTSGVEDAERLTDAHTATLGGRSYEWEILHEEYVDGRYRGGVREQVFVESPTRYVSSIDRIGQLGTRPFLVTSREMYADGSHRHVRRLGDETGYESSPLRAEESNLMTEREAIALEALLTTWYSEAVPYPTSQSSTTNGSEEGTRQLYRVSGWETRHDGVRDYRVVAIADSRGFVSSLRAEYDVPTQNATVMISMHYSGVGTTDAYEPLWYDNTTQQQSTGNETTTG
ncbi:MAG: hypothetical protein ACQETI_05870 [Halobacteriota archaeon]